MNTIGGRMNNYDVDLHYADNFAQGRVCAFPDCDKPITNSARYCREHGRQWREFKRRVLKAAKAKRPAIHPLVHAAWKELRK